MLKFIYLLNLHYLKYLNSNIVTLLFQINHIKIPFNHRGGQAMLESVTKKFSSPKILKIDIRVRVYRLVRGRYDFVFSDSN